MKMLDSKPSGATSDSVHLKTTCLLVKYS